MRIALLFAIAALLAPWAVLAPSAADDKPSVPAPAESETESAESDEAWVYPETRRTDDADIMHGHKVLDPYRWLEPDDTKEVEAWDNAQTAVLRKHLDRFPGRAKLAARIEQEVALPGMRSLPRFEGGKQWFTRRPEGANHSIVYVTDIEATQEPQVVLDPNGWSEDGTEGLESWTPAPNGRYVAYRRDSKGSENTTLFVRDLETGEDLKDRITRTKFASLVWEADSSGFYYTRMPDPDSVPKGQEQYHRRVLFHTLGTMPLDDQVLYGSGRPTLESKWITRTSDRKHIMLYRGMPYMELDSFLLQRDGSRATWMPLVVGDGARTYVDRVEDTYLFSTDRDNGLRDIYTAPATEAGSPGVWKPMTFPRNETAVIEDVSLVGDFAVAHIKENVVSRLWVRLADGSDEPVEIKLPSPGTVRGITSRPGDTRIWFNFQSYSTPQTNYICDVASKDRALKVLSSRTTTVKHEDLISEQTTYKSKDGTEIPIFILRHKDTKLDGTAPTVLYAYGGFRSGMYPRFSGSYGIWAERGGVWCVACLRGGDEFGEAWHKAGARENKQNVYDDMIAGADWLVSSGKASRAKLAIQGGSNGGLLVATCINQRPDLCGAVVCAVPLTDMLRYHRFQYAKMWTKEYGDPDVKAEFEWIRPYSPYHNVEMGATYPAILVEAGLKDGRVNAFHARKMVAQWQHATGGSAPILLNLDRNSGHGAASLKQYRDELTDRFTFLLMELNDDE